jgi:hypothetical protein
VQQEPCFFLLPAPRTDFGFPAGRAVFTKLENLIFNHHTGRIADLNESPMAYRRLPEVIAQHAGTVKVLHTLRPFAVAMAGARELDPWKD